MKLEVSHLAKIGPDELHAVPRKATTEPGEVGDSGPRGETVCAREVTRMALGRYQAIMPSDCSGSRGCPLPRNH